MFAGEEVAKAPYTDALHEPAIIGSVQYTRVEGKLTIMSTTKRVWSHPIMHAYIILCVH